MWPFFIASRSLATISQKVVGSFGITKSDMKQIVVLLVLCLSLWTAESSSILKPERSFHGVTGTREGIANSANEVKLVTIELFPRFKIGRPCLLF